MSMNELDSDQAILGDRSHRMIPLAALQQREGRPSSGRGAWADSSSAVRLRAVLAATHATLSKLAWTIAFVIGTEKNRDIALATRESRATAMAGECFTTDSLVGTTAPTTEAIAWI
jgi:hypothetical protein